MTVQRDPKTGHWFFRTRVRFPDGTKQRIYGTPGVSGMWHELPNTKHGAQEAERRAITNAMTGSIVRVLKEAPTIAEYFKPFMDGYAASHKPSSKRDKRQRFARYVLPLVGHLRLNEVRQGHIDTVVKSMLDRDLGRKGINTSLSILSSMIRYAVENELIAEPKGLRFTIMTQDAEMESVDPGDVARLLKAAPDVRYRVAILLCAEAGFRIGEARALPWIEVNEIGREMTIAWSYDRTNALSETKGWERRTVPISPALRDEMKLLERKGPLVFARRDGNPLGYDAVRDVIVKIYERAEVTRPSLPWHALRHTYGTELARRGTNIKTIKKLMGHKDVNTTMRYLHSSRDEEHAAVNAISLGSGWAVNVSEIPNSSKSKLEK